VRTTYDWPTPTGLISAMTCCVHTNGGRLTGSHRADTSDRPINDRQRQTQRGKEGGRPTVWRQRWLLPAPACGSARPKWMQVEKISFTGLL